MSSMRSPTTAFRQRSGLFPNDLAPKQKSLVTERKNNPVRDTEQIAVLKPSDVLIDKGASSPPLLCVSRVCRGKPVPFGAKGTVAQIVLAPIYRRIVSVADVQPKRPGRLQAAHRFRKNIGQIADVLARVGFTSDTV